jgi:hypothetical protein
VDDHETKAPTVENLWRLLGGVDFELRNVGWGILDRLKRAQEKLDPAHPACPLIAEAKIGVEALLSLEAQLQVELHAMSLPKSP